MNNFKLPQKNERLKLFGSIEPGIKTKPSEKENMLDLQNMKEDFLMDYLVNGRLHHVHNGHCEDHGPVEIVTIN
jgi:hypothetical protein